MPVAAPAALAKTQPTPTATNLPSSPRPTPVPTIAPSPTPVIRTLQQRFTARRGDSVIRPAPAVIHIQRTTDDPLKINLLLFDLTAPQFDLQTQIGAGWLSGRYRTSQIAAENKALASVNGDLFSEDGIPQGLTIIDSQVVIAPKHRATFAWSRNREPFIGYFTDQWTWNAQVTTPNGASAPIAQLNTSCKDDTICLYNRFARVVPQRVGDVKVLLDANNRVISIVRESRVHVLTDTQVLESTGKGARWLTQQIAVGDQLKIDIDTTPALSNYAQASSGGPVILRDGAYVEDCLCSLRDCRGVEAKERGLLCEDFTADWKRRHYRWVRMPRTGIGYDKQKQTLIIAVVDGYQRGYSRGITQAEFASLLQEFGADTAMELDGGGSATMVVKNKVVNRPPDASGERYVANALLFFWNESR